ncbi:Gfo/Idh/MocA family oxidoreductase [Alicyclobacillus sacchari]|uniref:Gfo/Idh/MocA family oxidoreductase n=1 Tax=Alicyclobacillus sacchari TaxID=392010 RepID=UPI0032AFFE6A
MTAVSFAIVGGGFRTKYFLNVARALPELFDVCGMVVRDREKGQVIERDWSVLTFRTLGELLAVHTPDFVVLSIHPAANVEYVDDLRRAGIPALVETPPAADLEGLLELHHSPGLAHEFRSQSSTRSARCTPRGYRLSSREGWAISPKPPFRFLTAITESACSASCLAYASNPRTSGACDLNPPWW